MVIHCVKCGRPVVEIDRPEIDPKAIGRGARAAARFGFDLLPIDEISAFLNPTEETIQQFLKPRCANDCSAS